MCLQDTSFPLRAVGLLLILTLAGCAAPVSKPPQSPATATPTVTRSTESPAPPSPPPARAAIEAVTQQAREHLIDGQYQRAISLAERGLRMDRRHWESYRILAESHLGLGDRQQALKFARQAVRFCRSDCHGARELLQSLQ